MQDILPFFSKPKMKFVCIKIIIIVCAPSEMNLHIMLEKRRYVNILGYNIL